MKRFVRGICILALGTSAISANAFAGPTPGAGSGHRIVSRASADPLPAGEGTGGGRRASEAAGPTVTEPGTLMLASLGLIALGAAVRRRRS